MKLAANLDGETTWAGHCDNPKLDEMNNARLAKHPLILDLMLNALKKPQLLTYLSPRLPEQWILCMDISVAAVCQAALFGSQLSAR